MSRRLYIHSFLDICGNFVDLKEEKDLNKVGWLVKENEHNIKKLKNTTPESEEKKLQPPMRDPIRKRR